MAKNQKASWQKVHRPEDSRVIHAGDTGISYLYRYLRFPLEKPRPDRDNGHEMLKGYSGESAHSMLELEILQRPMGL
jgi:hypothetical protein